MWTQKPKQTNKKKHITYVAGGPHENTELTNSRVEGHTRRKQDQKGAKSEKV